MKKFLTRGIVHLLMVLSTLTIACACWIGWYQSDLPQNLPTNQ